MTHDLDPKNAAFAAAIKNLPGPQQLGGYAEAYQSLEDLQHGEPATDIATQTIKVAGQFGPTDVTLVRSKSLLNEKLPMIFYTHGGGWVLGRKASLVHFNLYLSLIGHSPKSFAPLLDDLARRTGAAIVFPCYTLAPEKQFPFQFEQTYEVLHHMVTRSGEYDLLTEKIALAGDSVGGHMAIAMMSLALERHLPSIVAQIVIFAPVTVTHKKLASYQTFKDGPFLFLDSIDWIIGTFLPNERDRETALASPLTHLSDDILSKFPQTTIFLSTIDPLVAFGRRLQATGVDASIIKAEGQMHAFVLLRVPRNSLTAVATMELTASRLRKIFLESSN